MVLRFFLLAAAFLFASCADVKFDNPDDPDSPNYRSGFAQSSSSSSSSLPSGMVWCLYGGSCISIVSGDCPAIGGQIVKTCPASSSSSALSSSSAVVVVSSSSVAVVATSSSSIAAFSSSSAVVFVSSSSLAMVLSSSSVALSSSSLVVVQSSSSAVVFVSSSSLAMVLSSSSVTLSSSSLVVVRSSSSAVVVVPSSSSFATSSSSVVVSSSSTPVASNCTLNGGTVKIGEQVWMKENLNCNVSGSKCYNNNESNCATYGRLYNWETAMNLPSSCNSSSCSGQVQSKHQGICPSGWHIPSNADWDKLVRYVDGTSGTSSPYDSPTAGRYLKAKSGWNSNGNGEDTYGFSALPGGSGLSDGGFYGVGNYGDWWSSSEDRSDGAYNRNMLYNNENVYYDYNDKDTLFSVRCLQD